jgi:predicted transglutaminase-like protease
MVEHAAFLDEPPTNDPDCPPMQFCTLEHIYTMNQPENLEILTQFRQVVDQYSMETGEVKYVIIFLLGFLNINIASKNFHVFLQSIDE